MAELPRLTPFRLAARPAQWPMWDLRLRAPLLLGLTHGLSDGVAGLLLGHLPASLPAMDVAILVLLYNGLAFAAQPLVGMVVDQLGRPRGAVLASLALMAGALLLAGWPLASIGLAGLASALFHVGGGAIALRATPGEARGPGLFAAPGVIGLAVGGALAVGGQMPLWPGLLLLALLGVGVVRLPLGEAPAEAQAPEPLLEQHDLVMIVLLAAIALRSAIWTAWDLMLAGEHGALIAAAIAAAVGKVLGGFLADRLGWRRWTVGALGLAAPLLTLGGRHPWAFLPGIALLQSVTPVALAALGRLRPHEPGTAAGLVLGLAVAIGGLPVASGLGWLLTSPVVMVLALLSCAALLWWGVGNSNPQPTAAPTPRAPGPESSRSGGEAPAFD